MPKVSEEEYCHDDENENNEEDPTSDDVDSPLDEIAREAEFRSNIITWSLSHNINHCALKEIIKIINNYSGKELLPKDPRTLLQTPRTVKIEAIGNDQYYWHNGMRFCLENVFSGISKSIIISVNFNMDGLPIFKSSKSEFWTMKCIPLNRWLLVFTMEERRPQI